MKVTKLNLSDSDFNELVQQSLTHLIYVESHWLGWVRILNHGTYAVSVVTLVNWVFAYKEACLTQEMWIPGLALQPAGAVSLAQELNLEGPS